MTEAMRTGAVRRLRVSLAFVIPAQAGISLFKEDCLTAVLFFIFRTMFVIKQKVLQVFRNVKARDLVMKILFTMTFVLYCSFLYTCFNPVAGDLYPIYENISLSKPCELEGKRLFLERDGQDSSFLYDFFIGYGPQFYVYHLQYEDEGGGRKNILSYKFSPRGGIGAVIQGTSLGIDDSKDSIVVFYDTEPEDGFVIDSSSFSDRIVIKKSSTTNNIIHSTKTVNDCRCYIRCYN